MYHEKWLSFFGSLDRNFPSHDRKVNCEIYFLCHDGNMMKKIL